MHGPVVTPVVVVTRRTQTARRPKSSPSLTKEILTLSTRQLIRPSTPDTRYSLPHPHSVPLVTRHARNYLCQDGRRVSTHRPPPPCPALPAYTPLRALVCCVGGPALVYYIQPDPDELFKKYNPELQKKALSEREQRLRDHQEYVRKLKEYAKSDKPSTIPPFVLPVRTYRGGAHLLTGIQFGLLRRRRRRRRRRLPRPSGDGNGKSWRDRSRRFWRSRDGLASEHCAFGMRLRCNIIL